MIDIFKRTITYLVIAAASLSFLYAVQYRPPVTPHGLYLSSSQAHFSAEDHSAAFSQTAPTGRQHIGIINLQMQVASEPSQSDEMHMMEMAQDLAAQNGATLVSPNYFFVAEGEANKTYLLQLKAFR